MFKKTEYFPKSGLHVLILFLTVIALGTAGATGYAAKGDTGKVPVDKSVNTALGKADVVTLNDDVADIMLADPSIADVRMIKADRIYVVGREIGDTNLIALNDQGDVVRRINVHVSLSLDKLRNKIDAMYPDADVDISAVGQQVIVDGTVENGDRSARISRVVASYVGEKLDEDGTVDDIVENMLKVQSGQQVTLRVRIIEARRNVLREFGIAPNANTQSGLSTGTLGSQPSDVGDVFSGVFSGSAGQGLTSSSFFGESSLLLDSGIDGIGPIEFFINALEEEGLARVLAEPNLTALSGEEAGFLAGGEFPIPVSEDDGEVSVEFKQFGVALNFKPEIIARDRINLQLRAEVSSTSQANSVSTEAGLSIPGLDVRRTSTTVELGSGGTLMIAGMLRSEQVENMAGLPGLRNTPVLGDLMSSDSYRRDETEVMVLVTPVLVEDFEDKSRAKVKANNDPQKNAEKQDQNEALSDAFAKRIRARYQEKAEKAFANEERGYGYILE